MPEIKPTFEIFMGNVFAFVFTGVAIYGVGRALHRIIGRNKGKHFEHGRFIPEWVAGTYLSIGLVTLFWLGMNANAINAAGQLAAFGILIGLIFGWIHGSIRILTSPRSLVEDGTTTPDDPNPYRPPAIRGYTSLNDTKR